MPLTPNSRVYEQKLERTKKKYESRNAFATERGRKAREETFSNPAPKGPYAFTPLNTSTNSKTIDENWGLFKQAITNPLDTLKGAGKVALTVSNPTMASGLFGPKEMFKTMLGMPSDKGSQQAMMIGSVFGAPEKEGANIVTRTLGPKLASEISGVGSRQAELTNFILTRGAGLKNVSEARKVALETATSTGDLAQQLGPKFVSTIKNKSDAIRKDIYDYQIGDQTIAQHMEDSGLDLFHTFDDRAAEEAGAVAGVVRPVLEDTQQAVNESLDLMGVFSPSGKFVRRIIDPIASKAQHLWENDHAASGSVAKGIITDSAKEMLMREGKLTQEWRDSTDELLKFIDDPNNLRTVSRWYNQFKSNKSPEIMLTELNQKFPELAKHVKNMNYLDYLMRQWDDAESIAKQIPYAEGILSKVGGLGEFARSVPRSYPPSPF